MRKMRIMEHISLDGVIEQSADEFVGTKALASGVILNTYRPDGPLRTGIMGAQA
jgi:hypothetical protein